MNANNKRHKILISSLNKMKGKVMNKHMFPFQWFYELKQALYDHYIQILTLACYYYLLLYQDAYQHRFYCLARDGDVEKMTELEYC